MKRRMSDYVTKCHLQEMSCLCAVAAAAELGLPIPVIFWTQGSHPINGNSRIAAGRVRAK